MTPPEDQIVDIPKERLKFFGGPGKMLLPGPATVAALIKRVPEHKLVTTKGFPSKPRALPLDRQ